MGVIVRRHIKPLPNYWNFSKTLKFDTRLSAAQQKLKQEQRLWKQDQQDSVKNIIENIAAHIPFTGGSISSSLQAVRSEVKQADRAMLAVVRSDISSQQALEEVNEAISALQQHRQMRNDLVDQAKVVAVGIGIGILSGVAAAAIGGVAAAAITPVAMQAEGSFIFWNGARLLTKVITSSVMNMIIGDRLDNVANRQFFDGRQIMHTPAWQRLMEGALMLPSAHVTESFSRTSHSVIANAFMGIATEFSVMKTDGWINHHDVQFSPQDMLRNMALNVLTDGASRAIPNLFSGLKAGYVRPYELKYGQNTLKGEIWRIPTTDGSGRTMECTIFPARSGEKAPMAMINHGTMAREQKVDYPAATDYFLSNGYTVALPVRRGFHGTGGLEMEILHGIMPQNLYLNAARHSSADIMDALSYLNRSKFIKKGQAVIAGSSAGGLATVMTAAHNPKTVAAYLNFSGGQGAYAWGVPGHVYQPQQLVDAFASMGERSRRSPILSIYAQNDTYFEPVLQTAMTRALYTSGASGRAELLGNYTVPGRVADGHSIFYENEGRAMWQEHVNTFLSSATGRQHH